MNVAVLGSGIVGRTLAQKIASLGHHATIGTRDVGALMARHEKGPMGQAPFAEWHAQHDAVVVAKFAEAAASSEFVFNATNGAGTLEALHLAGAENLNGKLLIDVSNPLDFSKGFPPTLLLVNTDSLGEQIQRSFPDVRVVKSLNTVSANVMVAPGDLADGDHHIFVGGNDAVAKEEVSGLLREWFGWRNIIDLGDITTARGTEMYLALWIRLASSIGFRPLNIRVVM